MAAQDMLPARAVANFHVHVSMLYALQRNAGVDIGKRDFLGRLPLLDARGTA